MESPNGSSPVVTAPDPSTYSRFPLTEKQREFFQMGKTTILKITEQMNGALQYICMEHDIKGKATLSEDSSELIIEA